MSNEENKNPGAASGDDTSALFVSARKKQLAEQEVQRKAAEEEAKRKAAEEEVRRLEAEVAERKRQAEEEAKRVAVEARAKKAEAAANPDAILGAPPAEQDSKGTGLPQVPKISIPRPNIGPDSMGKITGNPKLLKIIGGAVALLLLVVFLTWGGGGSNKDNEADQGKPAVAGSVTVNTNAPFEAQTTVSDFGRVFHYPSSIFTVQSATKNELVLGAGDPLHGQLIISLANTPTAKYLATKDIAIPTLEANNKAKVAAYLNTVSEPVILSQKDQSPSANVWRYLTAATYKNDKGEAMYLYWWTGVWHKKSQKQSYLYEYAFECREDLAVKYLPIVERIWDEKTTVK